MTDAPDRPLVFSLPPVVPKREAPAGAAAPAPASPDDILAAAQAAGWQVDPQTLAGGRIKQRHGSWFGRAFGPVLIVGLVASMGVGAWKLVQAAQDQATESDDAAAPTTAETDPGAATTVAGDPTAVGIAALTSYPTTGAVEPTFRSVTFRTVASGMWADGHTTGTDIDHLNHLDLVDQIGEWSEVAEDGSLRTLAIYTPDHIFEPGAAFGAPWIRHPYSTVAFGQGEIVMTVDRLVAFLGVAGTTPAATQETVQGHAVTTYRSTVSLRGDQLALLHGAAETLPPGVALDGIGLTISADADGVVIAYELDARSAIQTLLGGALPPNDVIVFRREELIEWSDEPLGLTLPTNWVDG